MFPTYVILFIVYSQMSLGVTGKPFFPFDHQDLNFPFLHLTDKVRGYSDQPGVRASVDKSLCAQLL